jgi:hypothetical protein
VDSNFNLLMNGKTMDYNFQWLWICDNGQWNKL